SAQEQPVLETLQRMERLMMDEMARNRGEQARAAQAGRQELSESLKAGLDTFSQSRSEIESRLKDFQARYFEDAQGGRKELGDSLASFSNTMHKELGGLTDT